MANVSTNGIRGCAAEINSVISITSSTTNKIQTACNEISNATSLLNGYNGAIVKGTREDKIVENSDGYKIKQTYAQHWKISGLDNTDNISTLSKLANEVSSIISTVKSQVSDINGIASAIDSYIYSVDTQLSETAITSEMLSAAYLAIGKDGVAKANLATSGEDINNRNFVNYSDIKENGLANTKLSFVLQDDGSYKVYSNGEETEFYTTGLAAAFYQKTLKRELENNLNTASKNNSQTKGAAALAGASTTGNRNIGNTNDSSLPSEITVNDNSKIDKGTYLKDSDGFYYKTAVTDEELNNELISGPYQINGETVIKSKSYALDASGQLVDSEYLANSPSKVTIDASGQIVASHHSTSGKF